MTQHLKSITLLLAGIALTAGINYQLIHPWFGKPGPANIGSIEVSYVTMARFLLDYRGKSWVPAWYFGFPMNLFYTPLLPVMEAALVALGHLQYWPAYRFVTGAAYILAPVSVFLLGWQLGKNWLGGLISGLAYSVGPTIFYWLNSEVAGDRFAANFYDPRRFTILVRWGEGPHTLALVWVPLVGACLARYFATQRKLWLVLGMVMLALSGLSNAIGLFSAVLLAAVIIFVRLALVPQDKTKVLLTSVIFFVGSAGILSFWYNWSFVSHFFGEGGGLVNQVLSLFPWGWLAGGLVAILVYFLLGRALRDFGVAIAILYAGIFVTVVGAYYATGRELLPQALRYTTEADLGLSLVAGTVFAAIARMASGILRPIVNGLGLVLVCALLLYVQPYVPVANRQSGTWVDLNKTGEKEVSDWLVKHVKVQQGERVWLTGNHGFFLNYFTDIWQLRGGLYQASIHPWPDHVHYQLVNGLDPQVAQAWLSLLAIKYVVLPAPESAEIYKEVKNLDKFAGLEQVAQFSGNVVYRAPFGEADIARVVAGDKLKALSRLAKADDREVLSAYQQVYENSSPRTANLYVLDQDKYEITSETGPGEKVVIAISYDSGWKAFDQATGKRLRLSSDPLNFIEISLPPGQNRILLQHRTTADVYLGYLITVATVFVVGGYLLWSKK